MRTQLGELGERNHIILTNRTCYKEFITGYKVTNHIYEKTKREH